MASQRVLVLMLIVIFDLIAFGLAVAAELRRTTAKITADLEEDFNFCVYDSDIATIFGVGALTFLLASQVLMMVSTQCYCCGSALKPIAARACTFLLFLISWFFFLVAEACLLAGSVRNAYHTRYRNNVAIFGEEPPTCQTLRKGVFAAGAAFTLLTAIVSKLFYISYQKASNQYGRKSVVEMCSFK